MIGIRPDRWGRRAVAWLRYAFTLRRLGRFFGYAVRRFLADGCPLKAGGLGYVSLLAVVPLIAIGLAVLAGFPAFEPWRGQVQEFLVAVLVADAGAEAREQLAVFVANASRMTGPGLAFLAVAAILLMTNITAALNAIWRVAEPRPLALRFAVYWAVLTLGPLLIGASLSVSGYAFAAVEWFGVETGASRLIDLSWLLSVGFAATGFACLYFLVPSRAVSAWHALAGGIVAALLLELLKRGFGLYLAHFPSYEVVYPFFPFSDRGTILDACIPLRPFLWTEKRHGPWARYPTDRRESASPDSTPRLWRGSFATRPASCSPTASWMTSRSVT